MELKPLFDTMSTWEIATLAGVSETSVRRYKLGEKNPCDAVRDKLTIYNQKTQKGKDPRTLYFNAWYKRLITNKKLIKLRFLREILGINTELLASKWGCSRQFINRIEFAESSCTNRIINKYKNEVFRIKTPTKDQIKEANKLFKNYFNQLITLKNSEINEIVKLVPNFHKDRLYGGEIGTTYIKNNFDYAFYGPILKNYTKKYQFDILAIRNKVKYLIEVKSFKKLKSNKHNLVGYYFHHFKRIERLFPDFNLVLFIPFLDIGREYKEKFLRHGFIIIDKNLIKKKFSINKTSNKTDTLSKFSKQQLIFLLEYFGFKLYRTGLCNKSIQLDSLLKNKDKRKDIINFINNNLKNKDVRKILFAIYKKNLINNKKLVYYRNARKAINISLKEIADNVFGGHYPHASSFERGTEYNERKLSLYCTYLDKYIKKINRKKIEKYIKYENQRLDLANKYFPCIVSLREELSNELEIQVSKSLKYNNFKVIRNVEVSDKELTFKCGGRFPEVDILAYKNKKVYLVLCNNMKKRHYKKHLQNLVFKLENLKQIQGINKVIIVSGRKRFDHEVLDLSKKSRIPILSLKNFKKLGWE